MNITKLQGFECFWCKSIQLNKAGEDKYICKSCGNVNYKLDNSDNVKFIMASTYMASYRYDEADKIYQELINSENEKTKVQALFGRLLAFFGVTYIKDFNGSLVVTFSNYNPKFTSIKECSYYVEIINSTYKDEYIDKLDKLDEEYKKIRIELDKGIKYDIFICTKISLKTKDNPNIEGYTQDSKYANILYDELTKKGLKVFYSDKVLSGIDYDAQIYSALMRSEKILVISSKREYLESSWVQSEWERWINFIKNDVKDKNSLYLFVPNDVRIELPRKLEKTQKFIDTLEIVNRLIPVKSIEKKNKPTADELLKEAEYNLDLFKLEDAEKIYEEIIHMYPNDYRGWLGLVDILIERNISKDDKRYQKWLDKVLDLADERSKKVILSKYQKVRIEDKNLNTNNKQEEKSKNENNQNIKNVESSNINSKALDKQSSVVSNNKPSESPLNKIITDRSNIKTSKDIIAFGKYPQSKVNDLSIKLELDKIKNTNILGYIEYNNKEYKKYKEDYYLVEPIRWKVLEIDKDRYKLITESAIDVKNYFYTFWSSRNIDNKKISGNNYKYSNIRAWLNGYDGSKYQVVDYNGYGFINTAFTSAEKDIILETVVDNSKEATGHESYLCDNTNDKVYLLSYVDANYRYYTEDTQRIPAFTEYSKSIIDKPEMYYTSCLRSPNNYEDDYIKYIRFNGQINHSYCNSNYGIRPCIEISSDKVKNYIIKDTSIQKDINNNTNSYVLKENPYKIENDYNKAVKLYTNKSFDEAYKIFYELATKHNHRDSNYFVGLYYMNGLCVKHDVNEALKYFKLAANNNHPNAINELGKYYYQNNTIVNSKKIAFDYFKKGHELNNKNCTYNLGLCYYHGHGVNIDYPKAIELFKKTSEFSNSFYMLSLCYYYGYGVNKNFAVSYYYCYHSSKMIHGKATENLKKVPEYQNICVPFASNINGKLTKIKIKPGAYVKKGDEICTIKSNDKDFVIFASFDGLVADVFKNKNSNVNPKDKLYSIIKMDHVVKAEQKAEEAKKQQELINQKNNEIKNKSNFDEEFPAFKEISIKPVNTQGNTIENKQTNEANKKTNANQSINSSRNNEIWYWIFLSINILYNFIISITKLNKNESYRVIHICLLIFLIILSIVSVIKSFKKYDISLRFLSIVALISNCFNILLLF